jgi:predicted TIM-barrel fold metal-dependent hydrolase
MAGRIMTDTVNATPRFIDTDTHVWEQYEDWTTFVEDDALLEFVPRYIDGAPGRKKILVDGTVFPANGVHPGVVARGPGDPTYPIVNDPVRRLEYMDSLATRVNVIFPSTAHIGTTTSIREAAVAGGLCRAYNRYASGFASVDPDRLRPTMIIPANHPRTAAAEIRFAHEQLGLSSIVLHPTPPDNVPWSDPRYDVMWQAAEELGLPVIFHETSAGCPDYGVGMQRYQSWPMFWFCSHVVEALLTLTELIFGGVLERFPRLRIALAEAHVSWVPGWLAMLDQNKDLEAHRHGDQANSPALSLLPSEYFRRQCYVMAFPDDRMVVDVLSIAPESLLVSSDFPHNSGKLHGEGGLIAFSRRTDVGEEMAERVLVENAMSFLSAPSRLLGGDHASG